MHKYSDPSKFSLAILALIGLSLFASQAQAMPSVSGFTISLPDDGYYQVQKATDYTTVCENTRQCTVPAGVYIVINHSTGQRFEDVRVNGDSDRSFEIIGNTLRFPEGSWYQVQNRITFESLCNGERVCELAAGTYIVINHTLGQRYEDVVVGKSAARPTLIGNVISWTGDDWYQVQTTESFISVCEGGNSCTVEPGNYRVINLTTGVRYENFVVESGDSNPGTYPVQLSADDANLKVPVDPGGETLPQGARFAGDINGDDLEDIIVILDGQPSYRTSAAILFADGVGSYPDLPLDTSLNAGPDTVLRNGFVVDDVSSAIKGVGDVNSDGFDDLALQSSGFFALAKQVVLAGAASFPARLSTAVLPDAQLLVQLPISASLISAGDVNGDGIGDLFVAGPTDISGGVIYGATDLNITIESRFQLGELSLFPGCGIQFCSSLPIGDFDNDGYDDLYVSRFGANRCGYSSYTAILYGRPDGIPKLDNFTLYPADQITRIVGEAGGDCYPLSIARPLALGDVDGDGATDLILKAFGFNSPEDQANRFLLFGTSDRRRPFLSINELDGQRGVPILGDIDLDLKDVNNDGFDDVIFPDNNAYAGFSRDISSIDGPVVRRTPTSFVISISDSILTGASRFMVSVNELASGEFDAATGQVTVDDLTSGDNAVVELSLVSDKNELLRTVKRTVPAYTGRENITATLLAPRLVELTFNSKEAIKTYSNYLIWRDGLPIGRSLNGADNYIDQDLELGTTYRYHITPDYLYDNSFDIASLRVRPLLQRQSNSVTVVTPDQ